MWDVKRSLHWISTDFVGHLEFSCWFQPVPVQRPPFSRCWIVHVPSQVTFFKGLTEIMARAKPRAPWLQTNLNFNPYSQSIGEKKLQGVFFSVSWKFVVIGHLFVDLFQLFVPLAFCDSCYVQFVHMRPLHSQWVQGLWKGPSQQCSFPAMKSYPGNQRKSLHKNFHMLNRWSQYLLVSIFMRSLRHCKNSGLNRWTLQSWTTTEELKAAFGVLVDGASLTYLCFFNMFRSSSNFLRYLNTSWTLLQQYTNHHQPIHNWNLLSL